MSETILQHSRNIYEQQAHNSRMTTVFILLFIACFLGIGIGFDLFYGISKVKLLFIVPLFVLTFVPVLLNIRGKYSSRLWEKEHDDPDDFDIVKSTFKIVIGSFLLVFILVLYFYWNHAIWRDEKMTGMLLYVDNVVKFLDTPFLRIMPWGTALTIIMTVVLVVTSLRSGPASIVWSLYNTDADKYREQYKLLHDIATEVSIAAGIRTPEVVIITDTDPNAFAVGIGPESSYIMVTTGLISTLDREELEGVIAHEMSHIRNNDTELMTVITVLFGGLLLLADWMEKIIFWNAPTLPKIPGISFVVKFVFFIFWILAVLFTPLIARILAMSVSREREYLADAGAAELTRNPLALANALAKIDSHREPSRSVPKSIAHLCIADPLGRTINNKEGFWSNLFGTHPPIAKRIMLLRSMAYQG